MSLYPEVQRKAQEELDRVVGPYRLPDFGDYDSLIYIRAIVLEAMRWVVVVPLGLHHRVIRDDEYKGFLIPKGAIISAVSSLCDFNFSNAHQLPRTSGESIVGPLIL